MFLGQKRSCWTPRRERKSWQKSEHLDATLDFFLLIFCHCFVISADKYSLNIFIVFRAPKVSKDKQETEENWESEETQ